MTVETHGGALVAWHQFEGVPVASDGEAVVVLSGVDRVHSLFLVLRDGTGNEVPVPFPSGSERTRWYKWDGDLTVESDWAPDDGHTLWGWVEYTEAP